MMGVFTKEEASFDLDENAVDLDIEPLLGGTEESEHAVPQPGTRSRDFGRAAYVQYRNQKTAQIRQN